jgi:hypothetical protein
MVNWIWLKPEMEPSSGIVCEECGGETTPGASCFWCERESVNCVGDIDILARKVGLENIICYKTTCYDPPLYK